VLVEALRTVAGRTQRASDVDNGHGCSVFRAYVGDPCGRGRGEALAASPTSWTFTPVWQGTRPVGETLRGSARVAMMEAAAQGRRDDLAPVGRLHPSGLRGVLVEGQGSPGPVVVGEIRVQHVAPVGVVEPHPVIEALAAQGSR